MKKAMEMRNDLHGFFYGRFIVAGKSGAAAHNKDSGAFRDKVFP